MKKSLVFGLAMVVCVAIAGESQAGPFGLFGGRGGCGGGRHHGGCGGRFHHGGGCNSGFYAAPSCGSPCQGGGCGQPSAVPYQPSAPQVLPKAPSSVGGYNGQPIQNGQIIDLNTYNGPLQPGMWIMTANGPAQITSVGPAQPLTMPGSPTSNPPTIRKLPEPEKGSQPGGDTRPKAPKSGQ